MRRLHRVLAALALVPVAGARRLLRAARRRDDRPGLLARGQFDPGGVARGARAGRGCTGCCGSRSGRPRPVRRSRCCSGCPAAYVLHRLDLPAAAACVRARCWCRSCCRPWWSGWRSGSCWGRPGRWGSSASTGPPVAIVAGLVFFNVAVVIRAVGAAWESLDPRPAEAAAGARRHPVAGVPHGHPARRCGRRSCRPRAWCSCSARPRSASCSPWAGCATPPWRPRSTCSPRPCSTCRPRPRCPSCSWSWWSCCWPSRNDSGPSPTRPSNVRVRTARGDPAGQTCPRLLAHRAAARLVAAPILTLVAGSLRADGAWSLANYRGTRHRPASSRRCSSRSPTRWSPRCGRPWTRPGWPCRWGCWSRSS